MQGVEDNTTIATFSVKVYYSIEAGEQARDKIGNMVDGMIGQMNKRFEELGVLTKVRLHCLEQMIRAIISNFITSRITQNTNAEF